MFRYVLLFVLSLFSPFLVQLTFEIVSGRFATARLITHHFPYEEVSLRKSYEALGISINLMDPSTLQTAELSAPVYWREKFPFKALADAQDQVEFIVLDIEPVGPQKGKWALAEAARAARAITDLYILFYRRRIRLLFVKESGAEKWEVGRRVCYRARRGSWPFCTCQPEFTLSLSVNRERCILQLSVRRQVYFLTSV